MFTPERIASATEGAGKITDLLKIAPPEHVLDLGCGIGRFSLELARRGFQVTGVDRTRSYLDRARNQAGEEGLNIEFVQDDMRNFCRTDSFNSAISMFTSFGYFEDPEDDRKVVANVYDSLKTGGTFLIDTHGKETLSRIFLERDWTEKDGVKVLYERKVSQNWSWMWNRWIMLKGNERSEHEISHRLYAGTEMAALLTGCGFSRVDIYGNLDGEPYDHKAQRLIAVGHK
ncbi:class I SAM-dependent methyltransferase [Chloroflexota bacterium]